MQGDIENEDKLASAIIILCHRCSPRSLMLRHQKIYCASLCAVFCWPYGRVEAPSKNDTSRSAR